MKEKRAEGKTVLILSGGTIDEATALPEIEKIHADSIIAADRGLLFCSRSGIMPDRIVGDFDSLEEACDTGPELLREYRKRGIPIDRFNPVKDTTDTEIALEKALEEGATRICLFGATGTRADHTLSNLLNLVRLRDRGVTGVIIDSHNRVTMPAGTEMTICRDSQYGNRISLFPVRGEVTGLSISGVKYPKENAVLVQGDGGLFVSNEILEDVCEIRWQSGALLVMETKD